MRRFLNGAALVAALIALVSGSALSQADTMLHATQLMSPAELDSTGISTLSPVQRAALDAWLTRYAATAARSTTQAVPPREIVIRRASVRNGFRVSQILDDGTSIALDDGTVWEVDLPERPTVNTWHVGDYVLVRRSGIAVNIGGAIFPFALINGRDARNSRVDARLIGRLPGGAP